MKNRGLSYGNPFLYDTSNKLNDQIAMHIVHHENNNDKLYQIYDDN